MFADDSVIFTESVAEASDLRDNTAHVMQSTGLKNNSNKTKIMATVNHCPLNGVQTEQVKSLNIWGK